MSIDAYARAAAKRAEKLAKSGVSSEQINQSISSYLAKHPVSSGASPEQALQIESNAQNISALREQLGSIYTLLDEI